jgi:TM2 domain-containing membrane protein YozV
MNCANHTERTATAFCQNCGKALCPECTRSHSVDGLLLCEPCLLARYPGYVPGSTVPGSTFPGSSIPGSPGIPGNPQMPYTPVPNAAGQYPRPAYAGQPSPFLAGLLGFIPGVGAMYNGQFIKGLIHVVIFIVLIGISAHLPLFGILIAAWVFYQVFDAAHTAAARRDGRPLPDPLGLLDLSHRMGPNAAYPSPTAPGYTRPVTGGYASPVNAPYTAPPASGFASSPSSGPAYVPPAANYSAPGNPSPFTPVGSAYAPVPPPAYYVKRRGEPIGAIILIALGVIFLLNTLDVLDFDWISRGWPIFLLVLGVWLLIRRTTRGSGVYQPGQPAPAGAYTPATPAPPTPAHGSSLSIYSPGSVSESASGTPSAESDPSTRSSFRSSSEEEK